MPRFTSLVALTAAFAATNVLAQFVTPDGTCGAFFAYTCTGGSYGSCCNSATSKCGDDADSCVNSCDPNYGMCGMNMMAAAPSMSSSVIVVGGVNGAGLAPTMAASSANNGYTVPTSSAAAGQMSIMQSPVYMAPQKSSSMMMMSHMMMSSSMTKMPSPSMAMDGLVVSAPSSASLSMSMPPPSGKPHYSAMMMDPEYNATVTVTNCNKTTTACHSCTKTGMPTGAWNGSMPMVSPAMPTGTSGVCHKCMEGFTGGASSDVSLKVTSLGVALAAAFGFAVLLG